MNLEDEIGETVIDDVVEFVALLEALSTDGLGYITYMYSPSFVEGRLTVDISIQASA